MAFLAGPPGTAVASLRSTGYFSGDPSAPPSPAPSLQEVLLGPGRLRPTSSGLSLRFSLSLSCSRLWSSMLPGHHKGWCRSIPPHTCLWTRKEQNWKDTRFALYESGLSFRNSRQESGLWSGTRVDVSQLPRSPARASVSPTPQLCKNDGDGTSPPRVLTRIQ